MTPGIPMFGRPHLAILGGRSGPAEDGVPSDEQARAERVVLRATCPNCGSTATLSLDAGQAVAWSRGKLVQDAFPDLTAEERERLVSGWCDPCWALLAGDDDE